MASTYTTDLAIQLMATGENAGTWGQITNTNLVVVQQAIAGYESISIAGGAQTTALVMTQNSLANARNAVIKLTGTITGNQIVTIPNGIQKTWIISNGTTGAFTVQFKYASTGTGQTWSTTDKGIKILYADGSDIQVADLSTLSGQIVAAQITNSTITQAKLASNSVGTAQLQTGAVTAVKITQSTITQAKLAANSVGSNQLISTGVTPASYTTASITVDADGRITAAASGAAAGGMGVFTRYTNGPATGTHTANSIATSIGAYLFAGGGGGSGGSNDRPGGIGGEGGFGLYVAPVVAPFSTPFSIGAGGTGGPGGPGTRPAAPSGGNTTLTGVGTVTGGQGAPSHPQFQPGPTGSNGAAPGAALAYPNKGFVLGPAASSIGVGGAAGSQPNPGGAGTAGTLVVFENIGS